MCIRILQGIACIRASDGSLRLLADLSLRCYSDFPATAFFNFMFLFVYVIAFPVLCVYLVYRGTHKSTPHSRGASAISTPSHSIGNADDADKQPVPDELPDADKQSASTKHTQPVAQGETSDSNEPAEKQVTTLASRMNRQSTSRVVHDRLHDPKRTSKYGFLYRDLKVSTSASNCFVFFCAFSALVLNFDLLDSLSDLFWDFTNRTSTFGLAV